ncbi:hypothetical protein ACIBCU_26385 [Streptomyces sp. NPDC051064]|uniref:hypothetical protein n=1 Tax=Streptomyces sp. NPDC051064 TaxID=3365641 RepID=UPI00379AB90E
MSSSTPRPTLTWGQILVLIAACVPMAGAGVAGGWGTYTNIAAEFHRAATAAGVVAAGEGVTLVLALVMVGLTMLGQAAPAPVRAGLWLAPLAAAVTGIVVADDITESVVYAMTPMAMSASAEGLGLLARRIVVHRTGVDMEVQRRNADTIQRLAYHRARAANHPGKWAKKYSARASWRLAKQVGVGDTELGGKLVEVQRERLTEGADAALLNMLTVGTPPHAPEVFVEAPQDTPAPAVETVVERVGVPTDTPQEVTDTQPVAIEQAQPAPTTKPLVICGDRKVWPLAAPDPETDDEVPVDTDDRLPTEAAANVIKAGWVLGTSVTETARQATRSATYVKKVFARLDEERDRLAAEQAAPRIALVKEQGA